MTQKKENIRKYKSLSTGEPCTAAQYVAEIICKRKREKENKGSLEFRFWSKSHKEEYQTQIRLANNLIKKHGVDALLHFLNSPKGSRTYSLGFLHSSKKFVIVSKYVKEAIKDSERIVQEEKNKTKKVIEVEELEYKPRTGPTRNTLLNKLRKAENGKD